MKFSKKLIALSALVLLLFMAVGCGTRVPVESYGSSIPQNQKINLEKTKNAITTAGLGLGWAMVPVDNNSIEATLNVRAHQLVVLITYDELRYQMNYKSSVNLNHSKGKIHRQYRNWSIRLRNAIDLELSKASL